MPSLSQALVFTTTMLVSSTVLYLVFSRQKITPLFQINGNHGSQDSTKQILHSCLSSEEKKRERKMMTKKKKKKKKKKVQFADSVKEARETRKEKQRKRSSRVPTNCRHEIPEIRGMPANRVALYTGILREQMRRIESSY